MGSGRDWLAGDWPLTGGVLNITAAVWTPGFHWWCSGNKKRTQNVSEYMLVLALCLVVIVTVLWYTFYKLRRNCVVLLFGNGYQLGQFDLRRSSQMSNWLI